MPIQKEFPTSPHEVLEPDLRWVPDGQRTLDKNNANLIPPLVYQIRRKVKEWRDSQYDGASVTSKGLLNYWFNEKHYIKKLDGDIYQFQYFFAQQEAVETIIYLYEIAKVKDKHGLITFSSDNRVQEKMFDESWRRFVIKMATGSGKTKVLSLLLAWSYFHKLYETDSKLSRNFLIITPNIIVLDRIRSDFDGFKIFDDDPIIPENGYEGKNWKSDFNLTLHIQDNVKIVNKTGNVFLTNIHRVFESNRKEPTFEDENTSDYFLGPKAVTSTTDSRVDLDEIVRDIEELLILNDEAHHIHDKKLAWFKSIQDIHNNLLHKGKELSLQIDFTATPKRSDGSIFVQTVVDYPLVEAIYQNIVKRPVLPNKESRDELEERASSKYTERFKDYLHLGYLEWKKAYDQHKKVGKKSILFVMTDDTTNCDEVADYLQETYSELNNAVLVIHTQNNGQINEKSKKNKKELEMLRKAANEIDNPSSKYKAIISVMVLKEGWDVKNVTTIVGLRPYKSKNKILPEQTLGRGLRKMYSGLVEELSVIGTDDFIKFVEQIKEDGVELDYKPMNSQSKGLTPLVIEVDFENSQKDIDKLDIKIPVLAPRTYRAYENLDNLDPIKFNNQKFKILDIPHKGKEIVFKDLISNEISHETFFDDNEPVNYRNLISFLTGNIIKSQKIVGNYDILYGKVKDFLIYNLFGEVVDLEDKNVLKALAQPEVIRTILDTFKEEINRITVVDTGLAIPKEHIYLKNTVPFMVTDQEKIIPKKSIFNRIIGDSRLELEFADFLENCDDIISYAKNYQQIHFKIDYQNIDGGISNYYPDFIVKKEEDKIYIVETKGIENLNDPLKMLRLKKWCEDVNSVQNEVRFDFVFVDEDGFKEYEPNSFESLTKIFRKYKD